MSLNKILIKGYSGKEYTFFIYPKEHYKNIDKGCVYMLANLVKTEKSGSNLYQGVSCNHSHKLNDETLDDNGDYIFILEEDSKIERDYIYRDINLYYTFN